MNVILVYILICIIWGTTWFAIIVGMKDFPTFFSAGMRFLTAIIILTPILYIKKIPVAIDKRAVKLYIYAGLLSFFIPFGLVYWGEQYIPSGLASVLFAIYPFAVAISTRIAMPEEKITLINIIGMITGFSGIVIIFSENLSFNFSSQLLGSAAVVLSAVLQSTVVIAVKKYGRHIHHTSLNYIPMIIGVLCFFLFSYFMEDWRLIHPTVKGSLAILYLGVFGSVIAFTSYYWLLKKISVLALSLVAFITPVVAIISGWLFLNEQLSAREISGSVVVLFGLVINNLNLLKPAISQYWKRNIEKHHQN